MLSVSLVSAKVIDDKSAAIYHLQHGIVASDKCRVGSLYHSLGMLFLLRSTVAFTQV